MDGLWDESSADDPERDIQRLKFVRQVSDWKQSFERIGALGKNRTSVVPYLLPVQHPSRFRDETPSQRVFHSELSVYRIAILKPG